ncbi:hypothetical protein [Pectinatus frisingensis]|nr:hypothetical protein [Pectinatus frisingensis]
MRTVADIKPKRPSKSAGNIAKQINAKPVSKYNKLDKLAKVILKAVTA